MLLHLNRSNTLIFAERTIEAVEQRAEGVERHGAATSLDEHLGRHSWNDLDSVGAGGRRILHPDLRGVVGLVRALVGQTVGRNMSVSLI